MEIPNESMIDGIISGSYNPINKRISPSGRSRRLNPEADG
jgi:hypothetical protein